MCDSTKHTGLITVVVFPTIKNYYCHFQISFVSCFYRAFQGSLFSGRGGRTSPSTHEPPGHQQRRQPKSPSTHEPPSHQQRRQPQTLTSPDKTGVHGLCCVEFPYKMGFLRLCCVKLPIPLKLVSLVCTVGARIPNKFGIWMVNSVQFRSQPF